MEDQDKDDFESEVDTYFTPYYHRLREFGVPENRMPTALHMLSHIIAAVDDDEFKKWMQAYAAVEGERK